MTKGGTRVRARIRLLATNEGGRNVPVQGGVSYRPNHNFFGSDNREMATGFIEIPAGEVLRPGETADIELLLWEWSRLTPQLYAGREWLIQEGPKVVGMGTILEVID